MTGEKVKRMLDACYQAKRIRDMLPPLPNGVTPTYMHVLDTIRKLEKEQPYVRISDVSDALSLPRPGITRTVKDMEQKGYLKKIASEEDGRVTYLSITEEGAALNEKYDQRFFQALTEAMGDISDEEADCMIRTIGKFYDVMCVRRINVESF